MSTQRLQKILADAGLASRRGAVDLIAAGRISVNGVTVFEPGCRADPLTDHIALDGIPLPRPQEKCTYLIDKPRGVKYTAVLTENAHFQSEEESDPASSVFYLFSTSKSFESPPAKTDYHHFEAMKGQSPVPRFFLRSDKAFADRFLCKYRAVSAILLRRAER